MPSTPPPFALLTPRLVLLPTPSAVHIQDYRIMYAHLHSQADFCTMAFGHHYLPRFTSDDAMKAQILTEISKNWSLSGKGLGDCAVGLWGGARDLGRDIEDGTTKFRIVEGKDLELLLSTGLKDVDWVGYVGVRVATSRLPPRDPDDAPLPSWEEMIELRYGFARSAWGKGYGTEAAQTLMLWAAKERGVKRFIAETEKENMGSGGILRKLGFVDRGTLEYWKEESEIEWEKVVVT